MKKLILLITFLSSLTLANTVSDLTKEFYRRDAVKLTSEQGAAINFLRALKFPIETITAIEIINTEFYIKDKNNIVCFASILKQTFRCRNILGIIGQSIGDALPSEKDTSITPIENDFQQRESISLTTPEQDIIEFLRITLKYPVDTIIKLEPLNDLSESFFIEDRDNMICFGSVREQILRCKNEIGITGVTFTGDSD